MSVKVEKERHERTQMWGGRFAEPLDVEPVELFKVSAGSLCRLWFMPNQTQFVVAGRIGATIKIVSEDGVVLGMLGDALVVVLDGPPSGFEPLTSRMEEFEREMAVAAWQGRKPR